METNNIFDGFDTDLYFKDPNTLTEQQRLQVEIALIHCTSIDYSFSKVKTSSTLALQEILKLESRMSLIKAIEREIHRRGELALKCCCLDPIHVGDNPDCPIHGGGIEPASSKTA